MQVRARPWAIVVCLFLGLPIGSAVADSLWQAEAQRFRVGLNLFPAVLGAVESLEEKRSPRGKLKIAVVYVGSVDAAHQAVDRLRDNPDIRGLPVAVEMLTGTALDRYTGPPLGGIFVASFGVEARRLRAWSERHRALVFSPFSGDVERGAVAGIHVSDQILPYINTVRARRAGVQFKSFFLRVARRYD